MAKKTELIVKIKGQDWLVRLLQGRVYAKENGIDSSGICHIYKRIIDINKTQYTLDTIIHELFHAFVRECNTESSNLNTEQMEELCCSIVSESVFDLLVVAFKIQTFFQLNRS